MVMNRRARFAVGWLIVLVLVASAAFGLRQRQSATDHSTASDHQAAKQPAAFDKSQYSLDSPTSPWVIVNKRRPLQPADYAPQLVTPQVGLRLPADNPEMQVSTQIVSALEQLFAAAKQDGLNLIIASAYRSYASQTAVYNAEVKHNGQQAADRESARHGHSEHQTGLAVDVGAASRQCEVETCFGDLPEGKWLAANAYKYGFIIRYQQGTEPVTGYTYEPWHIRYVGSELAHELQRQSNPPLETFFNLDTAPDYQ